MAGNLQNPALQLLLHSWDFVKNPHTRRLQFSIVGEVAIPNINHSVNTLDLKLSVNLLRGVAGNNQCGQPRQRIDNQQHVTGQQQAVPQAAGQNQLAFCCRRANGRCFYHLPQGNDQDMINLIQAVTGILVDNCHLHHQVDPCSQRETVVFNLRMVGFTSLLFNEYVRSQYLHELDAFCAGFMLRFSKVDRGTQVHEEMMAIIRRSRRRTYGGFIEQLTDGIANFYTTGHSQELTGRMATLMQIATTVAANPNNLSSSYLCAAVPETPGILVQPAYRLLPIEMHIGLSTFQIKIQEYAGILQELVSDIRGSLNDECLRPNSRVRNILDENLNLNSILELEALNQIVGTFCHDASFQIEYIGTTLAGYEANSVWSDYELATTLLYGKILNVNMDDNNPMNQLHPNNLPNVRDFLNRAFHVNNHQTIFDKVRILLYLDPNVHEAARQIFEGSVTVTFTWSDEANNFGINDQTRRNLDVAHMDRHRDLRENVWSFMIQKMMIHNAIRRPIRIQNIDPTLAFVGTKLEDKKMVNVQYGFDDGRDCGDDQGIEAEYADLVGVQQVQCFTMQDVIRRAREREQRQQPEGEQVFIQRENRERRWNRFVQTVKQALRIQGHGQNQMTEVMDSLIKSTYYRLRNAWGHAFLIEASRKGERMYLDEIALPFQQVCLARPISQQIAEIGVPPPMIPEWNAAQNQAERRAARANQRQQQGKPPLERTHQVQDLEECAQEQEQVRGEKIITYFAHDSTHYTAVVRDENGVILNVRNTGQRHEYDAHSLEELFEALRDYHNPATYIFIIIPFSISAVKSQYIFGNRTTFENVIVVSPLIIKSFGQMFEEQRRLRYMCDFAHYCLEDPVGGMCVFLNFETDTFVKPFDLHEFHITEDLIGRDKIKRRLCSMVKPLVTYSRVDISKLVENIYEPEKLKVIYQRSRLFHIALKSMLMDLRQHVPDWWNLFADKRSFLLKIRMNEAEIENLGMFFKLGARFQPNILDASFINYGYRAELERITTPPVLENLRNTPVAQWNQNFQQLDQQIFLYNRLNGIDPRNTDHPIMRYVSAYPGSVYDITNPFSAKFLFCHLLTNQIACSIWEGDEGTARLFQMPEYEVLLANPFPRRELLVEVNKTVILYSLVTTLHRFIFRTEHIPVKLLSGKTNNTLFLDAVDLPHQLKIACAFFPPLETVCYSSLAISNRHSFMRLRQNPVKVDPYLLRKMKPLIDIIEEILLDGETVDIEEVLMEFREKAPANYSLLHTDIGIVFLYSVLGFLPTINQEVGHVDDGKTDCMWNAEMYDSPRPSDDQIRQKRQEKYQERERKRKQELQQYQRGGRGGGQGGYQGGQRRRGGTQGGSNQQPVAGPSRGCAPNRR